MLVCSKASKNRETKILTQLRSTLVPIPVPDVPCHFRRQRKSSFSLPLSSKSLLYCCIAKLLHCTSGSVCTRNANHFNRNNNFTRVKQSEVATSNHTSGWIHPSTDSQTDTSYNLQPKRIGWWVGNVCINFEFVSWDELILYIHRRQHGVCVICQQNPGFSFPTWTRLFIRPTGRQNCNKKRKTWSNGADI